MINITNEDNMELMLRYEDNHFDLAIVDPPYCIKNKISKGSGMMKKYVSKTNKIDWDNNPPTKEYFNELFRVSKNQIIWGGNYFINNLKNTSCFVVWDKQNGTNNMADCELAWTSFKSSVRMYRGHIFKGIGCTNYKAIHETQKPVKLYEFCLMNYAKEGDKILDTHLGSGSIAIACHNLGYDLTACELDKEYYEAAMKRFKQHQSQLRII
jgi:site-specific DNA-methyltransferase (adenine-specific)